MSNSNHNGRDQRRELFHWKMKKLLLTLALYLLSAVPSWAQLAVVQNSGNSGDNMTSVTASPALTTTSGNLLVCDLAMYGTFSSFADSRTLTWTDSITLTSHSSDTGEKLGQKYVANASGGANHTFTLHLTAPGYPTVSCTEVSGAATSSVLDQTSINVSTVATTSQTSNSTSTTTQADEILMGVGTSFPSAYTATGSFTENRNISGSPTAQGIISASRIVSATGAYAFTYTTSSGDPWPISAVATFKAAAAAAETGQFRRRN
jgi:hypothetical protein